MKSQLSSLQTQILAVLASDAQAWTLTGGGALAGFHLGHRRTDDLDLFFHGQRLLDREPREISQQLEQAKMTVETLQTSPAFVRLSVTDNGQRVVVDLVAEPVAVIEAPVVLPPGLKVDTKHEILVNKLCALLSRSETRDLEDIRALVSAGGDLVRALADAPTKDGGFSPMTLAWVVEKFDLSRAATLGFDAERLDAFRIWLLGQLTTP